MSTLVVERHGQILDGLPFPLRDLVRLKAGGSSRVPQSSARRGSPQAQRIKGVKGLGRGTRQGAADDENAKRVVNESHGTPPCAASSSRESRSWTIGPPQPFGSAGSRHPFPPERTVSVTDRSPWATEHVGLDPYKGENKMILASGTVVAGTASGHRWTVAIM